MQYLFGFCKELKKHEWNKAEILLSLIRSSSKEFRVVISLDGNWMSFPTSRRSGGSGGEYLYFSRKLGDVLNRSNLELTD